ncbi:MAG: exodeoxyribonuclease I [Candidatus Nomurabacteria bacterium]|jgi:exodeoxyribonuclease-1|nr:exodeoxyribonuclease I [Candidatus Nomurabacteria bacterium]
MTYFFYDLETSGLSPKTDRIMQFAGIRTDESFNPIGEPYNLLVKLSKEILPSPFAILTTGITPQATQTDGLTEAELSHLLADEVFTPDTVAIGYNNIRFDDEFIRNLFFRNFYDAYTWQWADNRSRWDLLDVVRMTRALRPDGINWTEKDGKPSNKLTDLSSANGLLHAKAHDALSDVEALIAVAKLLKTKQPQIFDYLFKIRNKSAVEQLVMNGKPFVYTSGRYHYPLKTTIVFPIAPTQQGTYVYDLQVDPAPFIAMSESELKKHVQIPYDKRPEDYQPLPVKELRFNRCPAIAPLAVLQPADQERLQIDLIKIQQNLAKLQSDPTFAARVASAKELPPFPHSDDPDCTLYDGFAPDSDKPKMAAVRSADAQKLADFDPNFTDERLAKLLPLYKARNFPKSLTKSDAAIWHAYRTAKLQARLPEFQKEMAAASKDPNNDKFLLEELVLWLENVVS